MRPKKEEVKNRFSVQVYFCLVFMLSCQAFKSKYIDPYICVYRYKLYLIQNFIMPFKWYQTKNSQVFSVGCQTHRTVKKRSCGQLVGQNHHCCREERGALVLRVASPGHTGHVSTTVVSRGHLHHWGIEVGLTTGIVPPA